MLGLNPVKVIEPSFNPHPEGFTVAPIANAGLALTVMVTEDDEGAQGAFEMVQLNVYVPAAVKPVIVVVGDVGVVIVAAGPPVCVHNPVPTVGALAAIVTVPTLEQMVCAGPAEDAVGAGLTVIVTLEVEGVHGGLEIAHWNTYAPGLVNPVIVVVGDPGVVMVPATGPEICDHEPVPTVGVLPAIVTLPVVSQIV